MSLPSPRITPLAKVAFDPVSGLHCFPFNDGEGTGNHVALWKDGEADMRIIDLPDAGYPVKSAVVSGNRLYVACGDVAKEAGPVRVTEWTLDGKKEVTFVFGDAVTQKGELLALKSGRIACIAYRRTGSVNSQIATRGIDGSWFARETEYAPNEGKPPPLNLGAVQGPDGLVYILVIQDSNDLACLARHIDDARLPISDVNKSFLSRRPESVNGVHNVIPDGDMAHGYEMGWPTGASDPFTGDVVFSYQKMWFEMIQPGPLYLAGVSLTNAHPDGKKSLFATWPNASSGDRVERASPGIPLFVRERSIVSMQYAFESATLGTTNKRRWLVFETDRATKQSRIVRVIEQPDPRRMTTSPDGWIFYQSVVGGTWKLERLFDSVVPTPIPVPVPTRPDLVIVADKAEYRKGAIISVQFITAAGAEINGSIQPDNAKQQGVERRFLFPVGDEKLFADADGFFKISTTIANSWKGPVTIAGMATKNGLSSPVQTISVPIV